MRTKDIIVGEDYAVANSASEYDRKYAERATVLAVRQARQVRNAGSSWTRSSHDVFDGVRVRWAKPRQSWGKLVETEVVIPAAVLHTWAEQEEINRANEEGRRERAEARAAFDARIDRLRDLGLTSARPDVDSGRVQLKLDELERFLDQSRSMTTGEASE